MDFDITIVEKTQEIFFEAMLNGWANSIIQYKPILGLPGSKGIRFEKDGFNVLDYYFIRSHSDQSHGTTIISFQNEPVWIMHYGGWYYKPVIPFLKKILLNTYQKGEFRGGRGAGPAGPFKSEYFLYTNKIIRNFFGDFEGTEEIVDGDGSIMGTHKYFGGFFLP